MMTERTVAKICTETTKLFVGSTVWVMMALYSWPPFFVAFTTASSRTLSYLDGHAEHIHALTSELAESESTIANPRN